ncbi:MAG: NADH-quinone oxidoreductase subunit NuoB [PVC group bacterium]
MNLKQKALLKSPWVFHLSTGSCNNCDIEILDVLTPRFDAERFGVLLVGSPRHADVLLVTGAMTRKAMPRAMEVYKSMAKPCAVVAMGACSMGQGIFYGSYNAPEPVDHYLPVDVYVPGCPPKPEAMILGLVKALEVMKEKLSKK